MVELIINLVIVLIIACAVVAISIIALLALRLYLTHKEKKFNPSNESRIVEESFDKTDDEKDKEQVDYVEKVYKLVDDVLSGKQELGDNKDEA